MLSFSEKLRALRKEKGLSQEQLAELLNVSRQSVSKWESGQTYPEIEKLIILSNLFKITLDDLVNDKKVEFTANIDNESKKDDRENEKDYQEKGEEESKKKDNKSEKEDDEDDEWLMVGGFVIGISIGLITGNFMWGTVGCFLGLGFGYILKGIRKK